MIDIVLNMDEFCWCQPRRAPQGRARLWDLYGGFFGSAALKEICRHCHGRMRGRYVGAEVAEDDGEPFEEKMRRLTAQLREQEEKGASLDAAIAGKLRELGHGR